MGAYIKNLTTNHIVAIGGERIHFSKYAYKPSYSDRANEEATCMRHCGPTARAFENNPELSSGGRYLYVDFIENKTQLAEKADLKDYAGSVNNGGYRVVANDVWGDIVPSKNYWANYMVPVNEAYDTCYCDEAQSKIVGFLIPANKATELNARTKWEFIPAHTGDKIATDQLITAVGENARIMEAIGRDN